MKNRCSNPKCNRSYVYLEKGITVCDEWRNNFQAFYDWSITHGYSNELTLDRIDNDGNYEPANCRWVTNRIQNINKDSVPQYEYKGIIFHQCDVYDLFGVKRTTFQARLAKGYTVEEAITLGGGKNRARKEL